MKKKLLNRSKDVLNLRILTACAPLPRHPAFRQTALTFDRKSTQNFLQNKAIVLYAFQAVRTVSRHSADSFFIFITAAAPYYFIVSLLLMTDAE